MPLERCEIGEWRLKRKMLTTLLARFAVSRGRVSVKAEKGVVSAIQEKGGINTHE